MKYLPKLTSIRAPGVLHCIDGSYTVGIYGSGQPCNLFQDSICKTLACL